MSSTGTVHPIFEGILKSMAPPTPAVFAVKGHRSGSIVAAQQLADLGVTIQEDAECVICGETQGAFFREQLDFEAPIFCAKCAGKRGGK